MGLAFVPSSADILGIIILIFLACLVKRNDFLQKGRSSYYLFVVLTTMVIILLEIITDYLNWRGCEDCANALLLANICGFSLMFSLPIILAMLYSSTLLKWRYIVLLPVAVGVILSACSVQTGWIFTVDARGNYHRGSLFLAAVVITLYSYTVLLCAHIGLAKQYNRTEKMYLWGLYALVLGTGLVQVINARWEIMWGGMAMTEFLYYVFLRELQFKYDPVTGVRNRVSFEERMRKVRPDDSLFLLSFDVNDLKLINDTHGHAEGDHLLQVTAQILQLAFGECGALYRIGGDEFVMVAPDCTEEKIRRAQSVMVGKMAQARDGALKDMYIASGCARYAAERHKDVHACLKEADQKMYANKAQSKAKVTEKD